MANTKEKEGTEEDMVITHGRDDITMLEKRSDDFLTYDDRQEVWAWLSKKKPEEWAGMDVRQKEAEARRRSEQIVKEIKELSLGLWDTLHPEQKRELFDAWLTEHGGSPSEASPSEKSPVPAPSQQESTESAGEKALPGFTDWVDQQEKSNPSFTNNWSERLKQYRAAERAFEEKK